MSVAVADDPPAIDLAFDRSETAPDLNAKFRPREGWIGGDGAHSIDLGNNRTLWLFGDTWVGALKEGRRSKARIIHNSVGIQSAPEDPCRFVVRYDEKHKPVDLITPEDGRGWFWFQSGIMVNGKLHLFLSQADSAVDPLRPEYAPLGQWLAIVENPHDDPLEWCVKQFRIPYVLYTNRRDVTYGSGAIVEGDYLYIYGSNDFSRISTQNRYLTVARVPVGRITDMSAWRFLRKGRWGRNYLQQDHIADYTASDISVAYMPDMKRYLMVYTDGDVSNRIVARTAPTPQGPWSRIQTIHACKDAAEDRKLFCYAGKAHPTLSTDGKLVISYLTSSVDTWQVAMDARLYWPTFVTVGMRDARPTESIAGFTRVQAPTGGQGGAD